MAFYLANVNKLYLKLHHKNAVRIERHLRDEINAERSRVNAEAENKDEVDRENGLRLSQEIDVDVQQIDEEVPHAYRKRNFAALRIAKVESTVLGRRATFVGRSEGGIGYREKILYYNKRDTNSKADQCEMRTIIDAIEAQEKRFERHKNRIQNEERIVNHTENFEGSNRESNANDQVRTPFALRVRVQERLARIIAVEVVGYHSRAEVKNDTFRISFPDIGDTMDKWILPQRARNAFRSVSYDAIFFVGEHRLIVDGVEAFFSLTPREFQSLFSPVLAAIGDEATMDSWLLATNLMADVELKGEYDPLNTGILA